MSNNELGKINMGGMTGTLRGKPESLSDLIPKLASAPNQYLEVQTRVRVGRNETFGFYYEGTTGQLRQRLGNALSAAGNSMRFLTFSAGARTPSLLSEAAGMLSHAISGFFSRPMQRMIETATSVETVQPSPRIELLEEKDPSPSAHVEEAQDIETEAEMILQQMKQEQEAAKILEDMRKRLVESSAESIAKRPRLDEAASDAQNDDPSLSSED